MNKFEWSGFEWIPQERWGICHMEKPHWWYDESAIEIDDNDILHLKTHYNPKEIETFPGLYKTSPIGVGLVSCTKEFTWGKFEIEAKLPQGKNLWPAFWMWSWDSWPPEIDGLEAYSDNKGKYFKFRINRPLGFWNVQTNIHYRKDNKNKMIKGKTKYFGFKNPSKYFIKYVIDWHPNYVKFYYNGILVRTMADPMILTQLNQTKMNLIINNGVTDKVNLKSHPNSDFQIKYFKYTPYII